MSRRQRRIETYAQIMLEADRSGGRPSIDAASRALCQSDLFYLLAFAMGRADVRQSDWLYDRCVEVQDSPDGMLDLWAREHYKSTVITFAQTIRDILIDPEITVGIFSHTKPIARSFLRQIKYELETNEFLKGIFPDILYPDPKKDAPAVGNAWSEDKGITVRRKTNPKEATIEAHGLVDGQPTSKHFSLLVYDDVVTLESVSTPEMINKTTDALALSFNLGAHGGRRRFIGTRYHFNDTYKTIIDREIATPRIHPATDDGTAAGKPVFLTQDQLDQRRRDQGPYVFGCQQLQDPRSESDHGFSDDWLRWYTNPPNPRETNTYILVDPAGSKKKGSDYSVFWVVGLGADNNYYLLDGRRAKMSLKERTDTLFSLHRKWRPLAVGYEQYGMQADIEHIEEHMELASYRFKVTKLGGATPKMDRIKRLQPKFEQGRFFLPRYIPTQNENGSVTNLIDIFLSDEYRAFPVCTHDDMLDDLANVLHPDLNAEFPAKTYRAPVMIVGGEGVLDAVVGY